MKTVANRLIKALSWISISLITLIVYPPNISSWAGSLKQPISIEDLVSYTRIRNTCLSPDGKWVVYLTIRPQLAENRYHSTLLLQEAKPDVTPVELASFDTTAEKTFDKDSGALRNFGGQFLWSADSNHLVYTRRVSDKVQLWMRRIGNSGDFKVAGDFPNAQLVGWNESNTTIEFKVSGEVENSKPSSELVDPAMRITDDINFWAAPWYNTPSPAKTVRVYRWSIPSGKLVEAKDEGQNANNDNQYIKYEDAKWPTKPGEKKYAVRPILSPDKKKSVFSGFGAYNIGDIEKAYRDSFVGITIVGESRPPNEFLHTPHFISDVRWKSDSKEVYAILRNPNDSVVVAVTLGSDEVRELLRTSHSFSETSWNADGTVFAAVRQSSLMPDELIKADLASGKSIVLATPNAAFAERALPEIRFMKINNTLGGGIFGRLVLPNGYVKGKRYPLIFTTYRAGAGFLEGAVGDEFPILPFAAAGFAVFAMDTGISNMVSDSSDLEFTLMRFKRPLDAMEVVRQQLTAEGIIDPERCAITGLSYGADIVAFAVANTKVFKAASMAISGLDPIVHTLTSVNGEKTLATYGYPSPEGAGIEQWKKMSVALNAAQIITPILIQTSDSEAIASLETFKALRRYGVPVDWYVYLGEGHVKKQPLNKYYVYRRNLDWMKFWLKDEVTSDPDKRDQYSRWRAMKESFREKRLSAEKGH